MEPATVFINYEELMILHRLMFLNTSSRLKVSNFKNYNIVEINQELLCNSLLRSKESCQLAYLYYQDVLSKRSGDQAPIGINLTFDILPFFYEVTNKAELGLLLVRGLNRIVDTSQKSRLKLSFKDSLIKLGFPCFMADVLAQTRHSLTHKEMPSYDFLSASISITLCFLKFNFWDINIRINSHLFFEKRFIFTFESINNVLGGRLCRKDFYPPHLRSFKNSFLKFRYEKRIISAINSEEFSYAEILYLAKKLNLRKSDFLSLAFNLALSGNLEKIQPLVDFVEQSLTVSDFRNAFSKPEFRIQVYRVLCEREAIPAAKVLFDAMEGFKRVISKSLFVKLWESQDYCSNTSSLTGEKSLELLPIEEVLKDYYS